MKRVIAAAMVLMALLLGGCGAGEPVQSNCFTVTLTNGSEDGFHGFGVEWYENGALIRVETAMKREFLFLDKGEELSCKVTFTEETYPANRDCAIRVYLIGTEQVQYCVDEPMEVDLSQPELRLTVLGSEAEGWSVE